MEDSDEKKPGIQEYVLVYCGLFSSFFGKQAPVALLLAIVCRINDLLSTIFISWFCVSSLLFCILFGIATAIVWTKNS